MEHASSDARDGKAITMMPQMHTKEFIITARGKHVETIENRKRDLFLNRLLVESGN